MRVVAVENLAGNLVWRRRKNVESRALMKLVVQHEVHLNASATWPLAVAVPVCEK